MGPSQVDILTTPPGPSLRASGFATETPISGGILSHPETGLASEVQVDLAVVKLPEDRTFTALIPEGHSMAFLYPRSSGDVVSLGPWVDQYHLNPMFPEMVDYSDVTRPWPLTAPTR